MKNRTIFAAAVGTVAVVASAMSFVNEKGQNLGSNILKEPMQKFVENPSIENLHKVFSGPANGIEQPKKSNIDLLPVKPAEETVNAGPQLQTYEPSK